MAPIERDLRWIWDSYLVITHRDSGFPNRILEILCPVSESRHLVQKFRSISASSVSDFYHSINTIRAKIYMDCKRRVFAPAIRRNNTSEFRKKKKIRETQRDSERRCEQRERPLLFFTFVKKKKKTQVWDPISRNDTVFGILKFSSLGHRSLTSLLALDSL